MTRTRETRRNASPAIALMMAVIFAGSSNAHAGELLDKLLPPPGHELLALADVPVAVSKENVATTASMGRYENTDHLVDVNLVDAEPGIVRFAKECAEVDAIPLIDLSDDEDKRVFVGINFDGVLGIHGVL